MPGARNAARSRDPAPRGWWHSAQGMEGIDAILVTGDGNHLKGHTGDDVLYATGDSNWLYVSPARPALPQLFTVLPSAG